MSRNPRPDYGIDAPGVIVRLGGGGVALVAAGLVAGRFVAGPLGRMLRPTLGWWGSAWMATASSCCCTRGSASFASAIASSGWRGSPGARRGGRVVISDYKHVGAYARFLRSRGLTVVTHGPYLLDTFPPLRICVGDKPG